LIFDVITKSRQSQTKSRSHTFLNFHGPWPTNWDPQHSWFYAPQ